MNLDSDALMMAMSAYGDTFATVAKILVPLLLVWGIVSLVIWILISKNFARIARDKGYKEKRWFHFCFWLGMVGWIMVAAMPDKSTPAPVTKPAQRPAAPAQRNVPPRQPVEQQTVPQQTAPYQAVSPNFAHQTAPRPAYHPQSYEPQEYSGSNWGSDNQQHRRRRGDGV